MENRIYIFSDGYFHSVSRSRTDKHEGRNSKKLQKKANETNDDFVKRVTQIDDIVVLDLEPLFNPSGEDLKLSKEIAKNRYDSKETKVIEDSGIKVADPITTPPNGKYPEATIKLYHERNLKGGDFR